MNAVAVSVARSLRYCARSSFSGTPEGTVLKSMADMLWAPFSYHNLEALEHVTKRGSPTTCADAECPALSGIFGGVWSRSKALNIIKIDLLYFFRIHWRADNSPIRRAGRVRPAIHALISGWLGPVRQCRRGSDPDQLRETWRILANLRTPDRVLGVIQGAFFRVCLRGENWQNDGQGTEVAAHSDFILKRGSRVCPYLVRERVA